jgi:hypothetical protein
VNDAPAGVPTVAGTVTEDQVLSANTGSIADADGLGAFSYQWLHNGSAIAGATASTYTLGDADVGGQISVQVSYTDGQGTAESVTSAQTAAVANVNDAPLGVPTIAGVATEDQILTANAGGISDADGLGAFSYQWLRDGGAIAGATASTYTLGDADAGAQISVQVSYTDSQGNVESLTSAPSAAVVNVNDAPAGRDVAVTTPQDTLYAFSLADFGFVDSADTVPNAFLGVWIESLPAQGMLSNNGSPVGAGEFVAAADIAAGRLVFVPPPGASGFAASFAFCVQDDGGTANGGTDIDASERTFAIRVAPAPSVEIALPASPAQIAPRPESTQSPLLPAAAEAQEAQAPAAQAERAPESAPILLASADNVMIDAGGFAVEVLDQPLVRDPVFASAQRLAAALAPVASGFAGPPPEAQAQIEATALDQALFGLFDVSDAGGSSSGRAHGLAQELDAVREQITEQAQLEHWVTGSIAVGGLGLTVGYVLWLLRGGALLTSLLSTLPAWRLIDPLPVLARVDEEEAEEDDDDAFAAFLEGSDSGPAKGS